MWQACKDKEERLSSAKTENSVLLEHLQTLNQQLEAEEKKRQEADKAVADRVVGALLIGLEGGEIKGEWRGVE